MTPFFQEGSERTTAVTGALGRQTKIPLVGSYSQASESFRM